ncbi:MAG: hypothetical protein U5K84_09295 [Alkalibacterium sp.]|nr:hypothetical protein [Alkalibacterium sp.]
MTHKIKVDINLTELLPGEKMKSVTEFQIINEQKKVTKVYVGIEDPMTNNPAVKLVSSQERFGNLSLIADFKNK